MTRRYVAGFVFERHEDGSWRVAPGDGRGVFVIEYVDDFETDCMDAHPMRVTARDREWYAGMSVHDRRRHSFSPVVQAIREDRRGYQCPGGEVHFYGLWVAGASEGEPQVITRQDKLADAMNDVVVYLRTGKTNE